MTPSLRACIKAGGTRIRVHQQHRVVTKAKKEVKDLGALMITSEDFEVKIKKIVKQAKCKMG